jgi:serine/threonine-protein kinase
VDVSDTLRLALADRYTIERELGQGGMATVYLAEDLKHHRPVALKVLKPELSAVLGPERFLREIELSARLTHPHILPLHDSGDAGGFLFYVMPYVEGESLRDRLTREKQLPLDDALRIAREVADGLSYAHAHGVIHRDIKPENILLESGHAVVADFGIARAINVAGGERLTETGIALGTPAYMSPEQAAGSKDLDGRSDLYSLGCVLYEMLAGQPPFTGATAESVVRQHLAAEPPNVTGVRPAVPGWVAAALSRALAKTPADRFNPVAQFAEALGPRLSPAQVLELATPLAPRAGRRRWPWVVGGAVAVGAVLTGLALSGRLNLGRSGGEAGRLPAPRPWVIVAEFDGTADASYRRTARDLVAAVLDQSTVAATLPTEQIRRGFQLAGKPETTTVTEAAARELAVRASIGSVVTGHVDRVGTSYSVLLRLVRAENGEVLTAEQRVASGDDALIPALQAAAQALRARLGEQRRALEAERPMPEVMTPSFAAYLKYAEARRLSFEVGRDSEALGRLREALVLDPRFASAWMELGRIWYRSFYQLDSARAAFAQAARWPDRMTSAAQYERSCLVEQLRWHLQTARQACDQWVRERPNEPRAWNYRGMVDGLLVGPQASLEAVDHALALEPFEAAALPYNHMVILLELGRTDEARKIAPRVPEARRFDLLIYAALYDGRWSEAESLTTELGRFAQRGTESPFMPAMFRGVLHYVRGEVRAGDSLLSTWSPLAMFVSLATGRPVQLPARLDTTWEGAVQAALAGDTAAARAALPRLTADTLDYRVQSGYWRATVEAAIAWRAGDWAAVVRRTGAILRESVIPIREELGTSVFWLAADAYERLGRTDSAATLLGELVEHRRTFASGAVDIEVYVAAESYLRQHLIVLLARQGKVKEARRQWDLFRAAFTHPDPEYAHLITDAQAALDSAERQHR